MSYLLDTCVVSELIKTKPDSGVKDWVMANNEQWFYLSVITLGELQKGITKLPVSTKKTRLQNWIEHDLFDRFRGRILPITQEIASSWGHIQGQAEKQGRPLPVLDSLISATAIVHNLTVVTRNTADMEGSGVNLINPWTR